MAKKVEGFPLAPTFSSALLPTTNIHPCRLNVERIHSFLGGEIDIVKGWGLIRCSYPSPYTPTALRWFRSLFSRFPALKFSSPTLRDGRSLFSFLETWFFDLFQPPPPPSRVSCSRPLGPNYISLSRRCHGNVHTRVRHFKGKIPRRSGIWPSFNSSWLLPLPDTWNLTINLVEVVRPLVPFHSCWYFPGASWSLSIIQKWLLRRAD